MYIRLDKKNKTYFMFEGMLMNEKMVEAVTGEIRIKDISAKTMKDLLYFIYHDDLDKTKSDR